MTPKVHLKRPWLTILGTPIALTRPYMKMKFVLFLILASVSQFSFAQDITCKTEFTMAPYKKNFLGKYKRDHQDKFNNSFIEGTMSVEMPVNKDRSAYFTYSSHNDGPDRLTTYYKSQLNAEGTVNVSLNFIVKGKESIPQVDLVVNGEKSAFIELEEPLLWKQQGESKIMIESVYYHCSIMAPK